MAFKPLDAADACFLRCRYLIASALEPEQDFVQADLCRSALVMAVSALDSYMHWLVYDRLSHVRKMSNVPPALARVSMPFSSFAHLAESVVADRKKVRPWVQVKNSIQKKLLTETFQSYEQVGTAMSMAGIEQGWSKISGAMVENNADIKKRLTQIVQRRNLIVHEGDIKRRSRPRDVALNTISVVDTAEDIDWLERLISAIDQIK